jgi:hypothetical protein
VFYLYFGANKTRREATEIVGSWVEGVQELLRRPVRGEAPGEPLGILWSPLLGNFHFLILQNLLVNLHLWNIELRAGTGAELKAEIKMAYTLERQHLIFFLPDEIHR